MSNVQRTLPLLATRELVLFPKMLTPIFADRERSVRALERAYQTGSALILSAQKAASAEDPSEDDIERVGTLAKVVQLFRLTDGTVKALIEGQERVAIEAFASVSPHFSVSYRPLTTRLRTRRSHTRPIMDAIGREFALYVNQSPQLPEEAETALDAINDPGDMVDVAAAHLQIGLDRKQELLEGEDEEARLLLLLEILIRENEFLAIENEIADRVRDSIEQHQRAVFLRERLRVIQDELDEHGDEDEQVKYRRLLEEKKLPATASATLEREIKRLGELPPLSAELGVSRTYLDHALALPWGVVSGVEAPDIAAVEKVLDDTHYGLGDVKDRIVEYLAVAQLRGGHPPDTILCLVGPPGVGKTSVGMAIAEGLARPCRRISLGGVRDEAEIRGHRRTYVGAMPGRIIDALEQAGVDNPVILLDEVDKMESDWRGNPAAAMMEVLDPIQNHAFRDNYLELQYDLSQVLFIATANYEEDIPETLHDRLEIIRLPGYTEHEKEKIAHLHLIPKLAETNGMSDARDIFTPPAVRALIQLYTREAGVRELARLIGKVYRKLARMRVESKRIPRRVTRRELDRLLGAPPYLEARPEDEPLVGVGIGLAYTGAGGDILRIETVVGPGKGEFHVTGQLGEIMQESLTAAWGYLKTAICRDDELQTLWASSPGRAYLADHYAPGDAGALASLSGLEVSAYESLSGAGGEREPSTGEEAGDCTERGYALEAPGPSDHELLSAVEVRVHLPEGAVPKEGPSAGVALAASLFSALTQLPLLPRVALSGEITLTGRILAMGGLKEKLLAARREGMGKVVLPEEVRRQVEELPRELTRSLEIVYVNRFVDILPHVMADGQTQ